METVCDSMSGLNSLQWCRKSESAARASSLHSWGLCQQLGGLSSDRALSRGRMDKQARSILCCFETRWQAISRPPLPNCFGWRLAITAQHPTQMPACFLIPDSDGRDRPLLFIDVRMTFLLTTGPTSGSQQAGDLPLPLVERPFERK